MTVGRRSLPVLLTVAAAILDGHGSHALARDALLAAVPFAAVAGLVSFGEYLEARADSVAGLQALLWGLATTLLVVSCAARAPEAQTNALPPLGRSALIACLVVFVAKAFVSAVHYGRRATFQPAKP
jgi:hypothetical protein